LLPVQRRCGSRVDSQCACMAHVRKYIPYYIIMEYTEVRFVGGVHGQAPVRVALHRVLQGAAPFLRASPGVRQLGIDFLTPAGHAVPELARPDFKGMVPYRLTGDIDDVETDDRVIGGHVKIDDAGVVAPGERLAQAHLGYLDRVGHARALGEPGTDHLEEVVTAFFGPGDAVGLRPMDVARHQDDSGNLLIADEVEDLVPFMAKTGPGILAECLRVVCPA